MPLNPVNPAVKAAHQVYQLEIDHGMTHEQALQAALTSGFAQIERFTTHNVFIALIDKAEKLDADDHDADSIFYDGVAALLSFAMDLEQAVPADDRA